jgi:hypothetical protein
VICVGAPRVEMCFRIEFPVGNISRSVFRCGAMMLVSKAESLSKSIFSVFDELEAASPSFIYEIVCE